MTTLVYRTIGLGLTALVWSAAGGRGWAADFHVSTAQELQNALTLAAANGADDVIYLANGYYIGNFNYNSAEARSVTLQAEPGTTNTQVTIDGAGTGRSMNLSCSGAAAMTLRGLTFLRNCGGTGNAALRAATGGGADVLVEDCRFLSPTNSRGMGLELTSGQNVTVRRCIVVGVNNGGTGIRMSGFSGTMSVLNCTVTSNSNGGLYISGNAVVAVTGNTFTRNSGGRGGGARCESSGGTVTLSGNTFNRNSLDGSTSPAYGGGAYCSSSSGTVTLSDNTFTANSNGDGSGAYCDTSFGGAVTLTDNTFTGNTGNNGGGLVVAAYQGGYGNDSTVTLTGNTFNGNSANGSGGGAHCRSGGGGPNGGAMTLSGNIFTGNSASGSFGDGGGVYCSSGTMTLSGNTMTRNTAARDGGGLHVDGPTVRLLGNLVVHNQQTGSGYRGSGIWVNARTNLAMINNTVFGNTAAGSGGGAAFQVNGVVEILQVYNNVLWGNTAQGNGADVHLAGTGQRKEFFNNDAHGMFGVWDVALNNPDVDPQFFDPVNGDYHLRGASPLVNAGTNGAPSLPATDFDGEARIADGTVDIGCYEFANTARHPADVNADWVISDAEYTAYAAAWKNDQTWSPGPVPIPADYVTRAGFLKQNGGAYHNDGSARPVCWKPGAP